MWEPVWRLTQCGHRQRAWYRSCGSRFKSLSNLWGGKSQVLEGGAGQEQRGSRVETPGLLSVLWLCFQLWCPQARWL